MTKIASLVEKATSDLLVDPDWAVNLEICDLLNSNPLHSRDAMKAVKRRFGNRNSKIQLLALMLLEMLVKNCGEYVQCQVVEANILQEITKIAQRTADINVRDKILLLISAWKEAFGGPGGKFPQFFWAYNELRRSGLVFPQSPIDAVPIITPPARHLPPPTPEVVCGVPVHVARQFDETIIFDRNNWGSVDMRSACHVAAVLDEILDVANPHDHQALKDEMVVDLVNQCRVNYRRIVRLISITEDEVALEEALTLSDSLQAVLAKYDAIATHSPLPSEQGRSALELDVSHKVEQGCTTEDSGGAHLVARDDVTLMEFLTLNNNQSVVTDHDKMALHSLSSEAVHGNEQLESRVTVVVPHNEKKMVEVEDGGDDDDDDGFSQLARRPSKAQSTSYRSGEAAISEASLAHVDLPAANVGTRELVIVEHPASSRCTELHMQTTPICQQKSEISATEVLQPYLPRQMLHSWQIPCNNYVAPWAREDPQHRVSLSDVSENQSPHSSSSQASVSNPFAYPPPPWELKKRSSIPLLIPSRPLYRNRVPPYYPDMKLPESCNYTGSEGRVLALEQVHQEAGAASAFPDKIVSVHAASQSSVCNGACVNGGSLY